MNRGILATCYARPDRRRRSTAERCSTPCATPTPASRSCVVARARRRRPRPRSGSNTAHVTARSDARTGWVVALGALDNLVKGASGQAVQCANLALGLARDRRPPDRRGVPVSVTAAAGVRRRRRGLRHQGVAATPDLALVATADGRPVAAAGVFTAEPGDRRAGASSAARHLAATGGRAAAVVLNSGNANAATGAPGEADAERMCALVGRPSSAARPSEVLVCSTGLIGIPLPIDARRRRASPRGRRPRCAPTAAPPPPRRS